MQEEVTTLEKPHWMPTDDGVFHDTSKTCWCEPIDFGQFVAHRRKFKQSTPILMRLEWERERKK